MASRLHYEKILEAEAKAAKKGEKPGPVIINKAMKIPKPAAKATNEESKQGKPREKAPKDVNERVNRIVKEVKELTKEADDFRPQQMADPNPKSTKPGPYDPKPSVKKDEPMENYELITGQQPVQKNSKKPKITKQNDSRFKD